MRCGRERLDGKAIKAAAELVTREKVTSSLAAATKNKGGASLGGKIRLYKVFVGYAG